jgi:hypothetical protein
MNKKLFAHIIGLFFALSLVLAACTPAAAVAQQSTLSADAAHPATPAAAVADLAGTAAADVQSGINAAATSMPTTLAEAAQLATPAEAIAQTAISAVATALPPAGTNEATTQTVVSTTATAPAAGTAQSAGVTGQNLPVFSGLQPLAANDPKASFWLNTANQMAKATGFQFEGKAYVTDAKAADITAFYNDALKDWKATPAKTTSFPTVGNVTVWVYSQVSRQESLTVSYSDYDPAANKFLVITEHLWK